MHVVHVFSALYQGGAENQLELLIDESFKSTPKVKHSIISLKSEITPLWKRLENKGVSIATCDLNSPLDVKGLIKLRLMLKKYPRDALIVQCWMYHANFFTFIAGIGLGLNLLWSIRRTEIPKGITGLISKTLALISKVSKPYIISNSHAGLSSHIDVGYEKKNTKIIPNGFEYLSTVNNNFANATIEGVLESDFVFGHIGRYAPVKGHKYLFEALNIIKDKLPDNTFKSLKIVFIGRGVVEAEDLQPYINNPLIMKQCVFLGEKENIQPFLQRFDCFVLPSTSEGFPNSLVEAMLACKPCISSDVGDVGVIGEKLILMSKPRSSIELANNMLEILSKSSAERKQLGNDLKNLAFNKYAINTSWLQYFNLYKEILEKK
jgi:glycosyltransferase involved in cell wall biosynthesis